MIDLLERIQRALAQPDEDGMCLVDAEDLWEIYDALTDDSGWVESN